YIQRVAFVIIGCRNSITSKYVLNETKQHCKTLATATTYKITNERFLLLARARPFFVRLNSVSRKIKETQKEKIPVEKKINSTF
ncbi:hypothetical protein DOY81_003091, partial [Sarcophaga bullata]